MLKLSGGAWMWFDARGEKPLVVIPSGVREEHGERIRGVCKHVVVMMMNMVMSMVFAPFMTTHGTFSVVRPLHMMHVMHRGGWRATVRQVRAGGAMGVLVGEGAGRGGSADSWVCCFEESWGGVND